MPTKKTKPMTASDMGKARWKGVSKAQRSELMRAAVLVRHRRAKEAKEKSTSPEE